jgi:catechol 2,3-dioxygenase-like lactoylglutathione lyase family enzyme
MRHVLPAALFIAMSLLGERRAIADPVNPLHLRAHHITARVADLDRAAIWYQHMLGFKVTNSGKHGDVMFVELAIPGFGIALIKEPSSGQQPVASNIASPRWLHIVFSVPNPDVAYRDLEAKGASLAARRSPNGHIQSFLITDSEGNELEIVEDSPP